MKFNESERLIIHNCINEAVNGLPETKTIREFRRCEGLLIDMMRAPDAPSFSFDSAASAGLLAQVISYVADDLGASHFETRVGEEIELARNLVRKLRSLE